MASFSEGPGARDAYASLTSRSGAKVMCPSHGGIIVTFNQPPNFEECEKHGIQGFFVQTKVTTEGLENFASRMTTGSVVPLIARTETLWNPEAIWKKRPSGSAIGKVVFVLEAS
jgi:hypothetical protein